MSNISSSTTGCQTYYQVLQGVQHIIKYYRVSNDFYNLPKKEKMISFYFTTVYVLRKKMCDFFGTPCILFVAEGSWGRRVGLNTINYSPDLTIISCTLPLPYNLPSPLRSKLGRWFYSNISEFKCLLPSCYFCNVLIATLI